MFIDLKKRARNAVFWLGLFALVGYITGDFGFDLGKFANPVNHVLQLLVFLGILNNPTTPGISDEVPQEQIKIDNIPLK